MLLNEKGKNESFESVDLGNLPTYIQVRRYSVYALYYKDIKTTDVSCRKFSSKIKCVQKRENDLITLNGNNEAEARKTLLLNQ